MTHMVHNEEPIGTEGITEDFKLQLLLSFPVLAECHSNIFILFLVNWKSTILSHGLVVMFVCLI